MANTIRYDSALIYESARRLYAQASMIAVVQTLIGGGVGWLAGTAAASRADLVPHGSQAPIALAVLGALIGLMNGIAAGFRLRLQAQIALCNVAIEENTRRAV